MSLKKKSHMLCPSKQLHPLQDMGVVLVEGHSILAGAWHAARRMSRGKKDTPPLLDWPAPKGSVDSGTGKSLCSRSIGDVILLERRT